MGKRESALLTEQAQAMDDDRIREKETLLKKVAELKQDIEEYTKEETKKAINSNPTEEVCDVCGTSYLGKEDYDAHLQYRVHLGYAKVRERIAELQKKKEEREKGKEEEMRKKRKEEWNKAL